MIIRCTNCLSIQNIKSVDNLPMGKEITVEPCSCNEPDIDLAYENGRENGYDAGNDRGYNKGFTDGKQVGFDDCLEEHELL